VIREQLVNQKVQGRNTGNSAKGGRASSKQKSRAASDWQELMAEFQEIRPYLIIAGLVFAFALASALLFIGYRAAAHSAFFALKEVNVSGTSRTAPEDIKTLARRVVGKNGVWHADLTAIQREIEKLPWIKVAFVSRVLPDGIRVRVVEREPQALVRLSKDKVVLVDEDANVLGAAKDEDKPAPFILRGWDEANTDSAKEDNKDRVDLYRELAAELSVFGIASRAREVNLGDVNHVVANVVFGDTTIDIRLGDKDFGNRLKYAIDRTEVKRSESNWHCISYVDITQGVDKGNRLAFGQKKDCALVEDKQTVEAEEVETNQSEKEKPVASKTEKRKADSNTTAKKVENKKETTKPNENETISKEKRKTEVAKTSTQNRTADSNKKVEQSPKNTGTNKNSNEKKTGQQSQTSDKSNKKSSTAKTEVRPRKV